MTDSGDTNERAPQMNDDLTLESPAFDDHDYIPKKYTCDGEDVNPPLLISGISGEAKALALIVEDPDVPASIRDDGMWDHWVVFNIAADMREIKEGEQPDGTAGKGTNGSLTYHGPCPPDGEHRYFFKLYTLDEFVDAPEGASKDEVIEAMTGHVLQKTELVGLYERE